MTSPESAGHPVVLTLSGEIDFFSEDAYRARAEKLLDEPGAERLIVDLDEVVLIDSSGIGLLVDLLRVCRDQDLPMSLRNVPAHVSRMLDLTGLDTVIVVE